MKKLFFFLSILLFISSRFYCQKETDSLITVLKYSGNDSIIVRAINELVENLAPTNPDTCIQLTYKAVSVADWNLKMLNMRNPLHRYFSYQKAFALNNLGYLMIEKNKLNSGLKYYNEALSIFLTINHPQGISQVYTGLGTVFLNKADYKTSLNYYLKSIEVSMASGDTLTIGNELGNIGVLYIYQGNHQKALEYYYKALAIHDKQNSDKGKSSVYNNIAYVYSLESNSQKAIEYYRKALGYKIKTNDIKGISGVYNNLAYQNSILHRYDSSMYYTYKSLELKRKIKDYSGMLYCYNSIAAELERNYKYDSSIVVNELAYKIADSLEMKNFKASCLTNIGLTYINKREYKKAEDYFLKAKKLNTEIASEKGLRSTYRALNYLYKILEEPAKEKENQLKMVEILDRNFSINLQLLPENEKEKFIRNLNADYEYFYEYSSRVQTNYPELSCITYDKTLRNKGVLLKSSTALKQHLLSSTDTALIKIYEEWMSLKKSISKKHASGKVSDKDIDKANELESILVKSSPLFNELDKFKNVTWKTIKDKLSRGEAAIEFIQFYRKEIEKKEQTPIYAALIITKDLDYPAIIELCDANELKLFLNGNQNTSYEKVKALYGEKNAPNIKLYELLWKPIEKQLVNINKIYYSPCDLMHKLSFSCIIDKDNKYLCDKYDLRLLSTTAQIAIDNNNEILKHNTLLLLGGINYNRVDTGTIVWEYLPGTLEEVNKIVDIIKKKKQIGLNFYTGKDASEELFKKVADDNTILHISTHGFFFPEYDNSIAHKEAIPNKTEKIKFRGSNTSSGEITFMKSKNPLMRSGLALAGANEVWNKSEMNENFEDGVLTAEEVSNMNLSNTELVVLSACETGLGDISAAEGVYGLQRSFKMAGVKRIIMSLWQVPDKETAEFMTTFYSKFANHFDLNKAFQETQKAMRKKYAPYFWGAFILQN